MSRVDEWKVKHAAEIQNAWSSLLQQPWGRKLLFAILDSTEFCGVDASTFHRDPAEQSYRNGVRDAGIKLRIAAQEASPEMYLRMVTESMNLSRALIVARRADAEEAARE